MSALLEVLQLRKYFPIRGGVLNRQTATVRAVDGVSFTVQAGETLGVVGESGCGKSTTARLAMHLIAPDEGTIVFDGKTVGTSLMPLRALRRQMQMVFQDSFASLNPRLTIEESIAFGPRVHGLPRAQARERTRDLLARVGLNPEQFIRRYPHELSGGQRQRVNIARALALQPQLLILDESVSALDKSVQAQVLNLLADLKQEFGLTYLFISHDLHVVQYMSDRVMVMYLGRVAEIGPVRALYEHPLHPYTRGLLSAMPSLDPGKRTAAAPLAGDPPNPINPPSGCRFRTRCPHAEAVCAEREPALTAAGPGRWAACHMVIAGSGHSQGAVRAMAA
jgi:peptide/nickel transport system ATP-binding protein